MPASTIPLRPRTRARQRARRQMLPLVPNQIALQRSDECTVLDDRYELRGALGSGGMAQVYLGWDRQLLREVAVKLLRAEFVGDPYHVSRFRREAQLLAQVESPHVVPIYDMKFGAEHCYVVLRKLSGETLEARVKARGALDSTSALAIVADVLAGLADLHRSGIIHRDIKSSNILLDRDDRATLLDLGAAVDAQCATRSLTPPHHTVGTPEFMSPEQRSTGRVDERSDVYQVGLVLLYAVTGSRPEVTEQGVRRPSLPNALASILDRALHEDPAQRYQSAAEMRAAIIEASRQVETVEIEVCASQIVSEKESLIVLEAPASPAPAADEPAPEPTDLVHGKRAKAERRPRWRGMAIAAAALTVAVSAGVAGGYVVPNEIAYDVVPVDLTIGGVANAAPPASSPASAASVAPASPAPASPHEDGAMNGVEVAGASELSSNAAAPTEIAARVDGAQPDAQVIEPATPPPMSRARARTADAGVPRRASAPAGRELGARYATAIAGQDDTIHRGTSSPVTSVPQSAEEFLDAARRDESNGAIEAAIAGYRRYLALTDNSVEAAHIRAHLRELQAAQYSGPHRGDVAASGGTASPRGRGR
jgi:tRNA A-37 threonylcarbamoyl transferase component Bud32